MTKLSSAISFLLENDNYMILTHRNPDGDTLCSASALCSALRRLGKTAFLYPNSGITEKFVPYVSMYMSTEEFIPDNYLSVDTSTEELLCFKGYDTIACAFDHHPTNSNYAERTVVKANYSACGELIYEVIEKMCGSVTKAEADLLYIAVSTDTGCFVYANVNHHTFDTVSKLVKLGAANAELNQIFFRKTSQERLKLEGMIYSSLSFYNNGKICVALITQRMLKESGARENDFDDLASLAGRARDAAVSITIREQTDGSCKVSVRSDYTVSSIAICSYFGGGGHKMASGCTVSASPEKTRDMLVSVTQEIMR